MVTWLHACASRGHGSKWTAYLIEFLNEIWLMTYNIRVMVMYALIAVNFVTCDSVCLGERD